MAKWCNTCYRNEVTGEWKSCSEDCPVFGKYFEDLARIVIKKGEIKMFLGKDCNYAFAFDIEEDFDVFFVKNEEDRNKNICDLLSDHWNSIDTCILWAGYQLFIKADWKFIWERIVIQNADAEIEMEFRTQDELVEAMWETLDDINISEDEYTEQNWFVFPIGTHRDDIWYWFDDHHSKGVGWLMNEYEHKY